MRNRILALVALGVALGAPIAAQAQTGITVGRAPAVVYEGPTIAVDQRPAWPRPWRQPWRPASGRSSQNSWGAPCGPPARLSP